MQEPSEEESMSYQETIQPETLHETVNSIARDNTYMVFQLTKSTEVDTDTLNFFGYRLSGLVAASSSFAV